MFYGLFLILTKTIKKKKMNTNYFNVWLFYWLIYTYTCIKRTTFLQTFYKLYIVHSVVNPKLSR